MTTESFAVSESKPLGLDTAMSKPKDFRFRSDLNKRNMNWVTDYIARGVIFLGGLSAIVFVTAIFIFIAKEGFLFFFGDVSISEFFLSPYWEPADEYAPEFGILALVAGTASVTGLAMLVALPFSLGSAIYISEFATGKSKEFLKILVEFLAAIPSVVWGFVGLSILNPLIIETFNVPVGLNILNAGVILGLMAAPIMTSIAEDALKAVPDTYREASEAMGATKAHTIFHVILPAAKNGILGATLLGIGRAFGETMVVLMATGHSINLPGSIFDSVRALTATIAAELGETAYGSEHYRALFAIGIVLFFVTFTVNFFADLVIRGSGK